MTGRVQAQPAAAATQTQIGNEPWVVCVCCSTSLLCNVLTPFSQNSTVSLLNYKDQNLIICGLSNIFNRTHSKGHIVQYLSVNVWKPADMRLHDMSRICF